MAARAKDLASTSRAAHRAAAVFGDVGVGKARDGGGVPPTGPGAMPAEADAVRHGGRLSTWTLRGQCVLGLMLDAARRGLTRGLTPKAPPEA